MKKIVIYAFSIIFLNFSLPYAINFLFHQVSNVNDLKMEYEDESIEESRNVINDIEIEEENNFSINASNDEIENYIKGVVAAEMPASFEKEALKAQAVASRTYTMKNLKGLQKLTDLYQAYSSIDDLKKKWGDNFDEYYSKVSEAVDETQGEIMRYEDEIIEAVFHSTSAGMTENSENVWKTELPYLKSVDSKVDENAPDFISNRTVAISDAVNQLNAKYNLSLTSDNFFDKFKTGFRSESGYIKNMIICGKEIDAKEIRTLFGLRSTNFTFEKSGDNIIFTTKGYGHGAGMSQYGANFMAKQGYNYIEILKHYYTGIEISN